MFYNDLLAREFMLNSVWRKKSVIFCCALRWTDVFILLAVIIGAKRQLR